MKDQDIITDIRKLAEKVRFLSAELDDAFTDLAEARDELANTIREGC